MNIKKVFLFIISSLLLECCIYANDTYFFMSGGNLIPTIEKDNVVEMKDEVINIVLQKKYYEITVDFNFYNPEKTVELSVGFPFFETGVGGNGKIYDFKCWTNEIETDYSDKPIERKWSTPVGEPELENAFVRNVLFIGESYTKTKITYKSDYGDSVDGLIANYLYGTGSSWKKPIGKITVRIENNLPYDKPESISMGGKSIINEFKRISDNSYEAVFYNVEPAYTDIIQIFSNSIINDYGPKSFPAYFCYNEKPISRKDLFWLRKDQLRIVRNTIYALHGYVFKSQDLRDFFSEDWTSYWNPSYKANPNFSEDELSDIEKKNIKILLEEERS